MKTTAETAASYSAHYRRWLLFLLLLCAGFAFIDRVIIQSLGQAIKEDLGISDLELGLLGGLSFAILYSTLGLPVARLAERSNRINIIAASVAVFSAMAAFCGLAQNFWQLVLFRVGVGVGEAGVQSPSISLISDHYPPKKRAGAITIVQLGSAVGAVIGAACGGWIAIRFGWRAALAALAIPGLLVAILCRLTLREPIRGMSDQHAQDARQVSPPSFLLVLRLLASKPTFWHVLAGMGLTMMAIYGWSTFTTPYLIRNFEISQQQAGLLFGLIAGVAGGLGLGMAGFSVDWIGRRDARWYAWLPAIGLAFATPLFLLATNASTAQSAVIYIMLANMFTLFHQAPSIAIFQNMVTPLMRASVAFVYFFVSTIVGVGLGPLITGLLSDAYAIQAFGATDFATSCPGGRAPASAATALTQACNSASTIGVRYALATMSVLFLWGALHYVVAARTLRRDVTS